MREVGFGQLVPGLQPMQINLGAGLAEHFRQLGFSEVYNIVGGIEAWSNEVDASVPRY